MVVIVLPAALVVTTTASFSDLVATFLVVVMVLPAELVVVQTVSVSVLVPAFLVVVETGTTLVKVHGQSLIVIVLGSETVMVLPLVVIVVGSGQ